jgi:hypothetical protein
MDTKNLIKLEEAFIKQKIEELGDTVNFLIRALTTLKKWGYEDKLPAIIMELRPNNNTLWNDVDENTRAQRLYSEHLSYQDYDQKLYELQVEYDRLKENRKEEYDDLEEWYRSEIEYLSNPDNYNKDTEILTLAHPVNKDYDCLTLINFFTDHTENLTKLIENTRTDEDSLDNDTVFTKYFAKLFALALQRCIIEIKDDEIKIKQPMADDKLITYEAGE